MPRHHYTSDEIAQLESLYRDHTAEQMAAIVLWRLLMVTNQMGS